MVSQTLTSKHLLALLEKSRTICEASREYPSSQQPLPPRHLCTSTTISSKANPNTIQKILQTSTNESQLKALSEYAKHVKDETEVIELLPGEQQDERKSKFLRKTRSQSMETNDDDSDELMIETYDRFSFL
ncbi:unnamed protein product [Adineta ricciae]|uniref:Uncharacterized protein n=1 Tax=Adineta ricciae TaxID=249248 RepID=A0A814XTP5_ADIRI|nr:unnamed protein product [Adineta ricciae]CAF1473965.1 unnamed protein product [Adineta ricciae]